MEYVLRKYQQDAVNAGVNYFRDKSQKKPVLMVLPTGTGKSIILASIAQSIDAPLIIFQPTREILEQNYNKMMDYNIMGVSIYSASMKQKNIGNITLATIGSVYKHPEDFKSFKYIIIDECHNVSAFGGMYKTFIDAVGEKLIGLTATPYRLSHDGYGGSILKFLTRTNPRIFSKVIHVTQTADMSRQGYFAKTEYYTIKGFNRSEIQLNSTGADYLDTSEREYYDRTSFASSLVSVVNRLLKAGKTRILVFTKFVDEARSLAESLGDVAAMVSGDMDNKDSDRIIKGFKSGEIKVACNVGVLTTGFDYPELQVVLLARPTRSLALFYQMCGRCVRTHESKESAWIVDMCGNFEIFGRLEDMYLVECGHNQWSVVSKGVQLTNVYLDKIMRN
jgi:DNA repair protein RadD